MLPAEDEVTITPVAMFTIKGNSFVSGLFWQPLSRPRAFMQEAREIGKREDMDIVAIRHGSIIQAGFVSRGAGVTKGMYSLAAALAGILGDSWLGIFTLGEDRFALVGVKDGAILPGCDLVGDQEAVREKLQLYSGFFTDEHDKFYGPPQFGISNEELDLEDLLVSSRLKKQYRLRQLTFGLTSKELVVVSVLLIAAIGGAFGYFQWTDHQAQLLRAERIRIAEQQRLELEALNAKTEQQQTLQALEHPWAKTPLIDDFWSTCTSKMFELPLAFSGWRFQSAKCTSDQLASTYERTGNSTVQDFIFGATGRFPSAPAFFGEGQGAALSQPVEMGAGGDEALGDLETLLNQFTSHFQRLEIKPLISEKPEDVKPKTQLPGADGQPVEDKTPKPNWRTFTFSFETLRSPAEVLSGLNNRGLRLTAIIVNLNSGSAQLTWKVEGEIYAQK